jgi:hypothetical protein
VGAKTIRMVQDEVAPKVVPHVPPERENGAGTVKLMPANGRPVVMVRVWELLVVPVLTEPKLREVGLTIAAAPVPVNETWGTAVLPPMLKVPE